MLKYDDDGRRIYNPPGEQEEVASLKEIAHAVLIHHLTEMGEILKAHLANAVKGESKGKTCLEEDTVELYTETSDLQEYLAGGHCWMWLEAELQRAYADVQSGRTSLEVLKTEGWDY